jgi:hypothetical protein
MSLIRFQHYDGTIHEATGPIGSSRLIRPHVRPQPIHRESGPPPRGKWQALPVIQPGGGIEWKRRPRPTLSMAVAWAQAATLGKWAGEDVAAERTERYCKGCDMLREDKRGFWCGACGCGVSAVDRELKNLAAYAENLEGLPGYNPAMASWGCKHPLRGKPKDPAKPDGPYFGWPIPIE